MKFNWGDDDFRDIPEETAEDYVPEPTPAPQPRQAQPRPQTPVQNQPSAPEQEEVDLSGIDLDEEDDFTAVLSDARLRLEQGRLYEMIMNHDLFANLDADARAIKMVQRQIKKFAKEQMEIMLGMRQEMAKVENLSIDFPFNQVEVTVLKKLAHAASKGASENSDKFVPQVTKTTESVPIAKVVKKETLTPISSKPQPPQQPAPKPVVKKEAPKPLATKPASAISRQIKDIAAQERVSVESLELEYKPIDKPLSELTSDELAERNRLAAERQASRKAALPKNALPQPTYEQQEMLYQQRVLEVSPGVSAIMGLLNKNKP